MVRSKKTLVLMAACIAGVTAWSSAASAGLLYNPVVTVVGDGTTALSNASIQATVAIYVPTVASQAAPISFASFLSGSTGTRLTNSGSATSEGLLSNNPGVSDAAASGVAFTGSAYTYSAGYNNASGLSGVVSAAGIDRSVGQVNVSGLIAANATVLQTQPQATVYDTNNIRGATGDDTGSVLYSAGTATTSTKGGWRNFSTGALLSSTPTNVRAVELLGGNLFGTTGSGSARGIYVIDATGAVAATPYITTGTGTSPYEFALFNDPTNPNSSLGYNVAYIADDGNVNSGGGIEKWIYDGTTWTEPYILRATSTTVYRGLAGQVDPDTGLVTLYASTGDSGLNKLQQVTDTGASSSFITLATASSNTAFRGVALAPVPEPASLGMLALGGLLLLRRRK